MKERPILFSAPMVRALLDGSKTQTRRAVKRFEVRSGMPEPEMASLLRCCPYGQPGDLLWVRESFQTHTGSYGESIVYAYRATDDQRLGPWKPSIHMPRAASRITLEVTGVHIDRLQDISRGDAMEEGCPFPNMAQGPDPRQWYADLWEQINGPDSWATNTWVWVVEFRRA